MFSKSDIAAAIAYNKTATVTFYDVTKSGAIRFDMRYMHTQALNALMQKQIVTQADFELFKKQVRSALKTQQVTA